MGIKVLNPWMGFIGGLCGWAFILAEIFAGEAGGMAGQCSEAVSTSFKNMRLIVTLGWSIYPLGYFFGYLLGSVSDDALNITYNIADFVNKIAFGFHAGPAPKPTLQARSAPYWVEASE